MNIGQYENGTFVQYELDIFANRENTMHSGIEFMQGRQIPHAYFKVFHTHQCNERLESELTMSLLRYKHHDAARYLDEARSRLGSPLTSVFEASPSLLGTSGRVQRFTGGPDDPQGASVYSSKYGTYPIWGWITECHERCGGTSGRLGFPTSPELDAWPSPQGTTGQVQRFEGGPHDAWPVGGDEWDYSKGVSVYSSPHGAFPVWGGIGICYEHLGGTGSAFGFPTSPELTAIASPQGTMGWVQRFEGGDMYWCDAYDGIPVEQPILTIFEKSGGSGGKFGFPKSPAVSDPVHPYHYIQEFEGGVIQSFYQSSTQ